MSRPRHPVVSNASSTWPSSAAFSDLRAIGSLLARAGGHHGVGPLRRALRIYLPADLTFSELERRFLAAVRKADLPSPSANAAVDGFMLDVYWPELRFAVELDVYETHGGHASFESDRLRQEELKLHGVEMIRITGPRFDADSGEVIDRLERHLTQRHRELSSTHALDPRTAPYPRPRSPSQSDSG